jgi:hypothetical protein
LESSPADGEAAFQFARAQGWIPSQAKDTDSVTLGALSLLMMKAFNLEGGLLYRLFPNSRYAYREMVRRGFIEGRAYSTLTVSGAQFLRITGAVLEKKGGEY